MFLDIFIINYVGWKKELIDWRFGSNVFARSI